MYHLNNDHWLYTAKGEKRGYIQPKRLTELWFHTGTNCNLKCPFCLEGSKPGDNRINFLSFDDIVSYVEEAIELNVQKFSFTGGEPFINPDMVRILDLALNHRSCLVLTNATEPLMNRFHEILSLIEKPNMLNFRVSLDFPDPNKHDDSRGKGNFQKSLTTLGRLHKHGFGISVARLIKDGEDVEAVNQDYIPYFQSVGLPKDLRIVAFPDFYRPGCVQNVPEITDGCMTTYLTEHRRDDFMCNFSKMVVKKNGRVGIYACTLVDDDGDYDLGTTLKESMKVRVMLGHHRCYSCFAYGASCSEG